MNSDNKDSWMHPSEVRDVYDRYSNDQFADKSVRNQFCLALSETKSANIGCSEFNKVEIK